MILRIIELVISNINVTVKRMINVFVNGGGRVQIFSIISMECRN